MGKSQVDRLVEIEDHLLCMSEVPNVMGLVELCMNGIAAKADIINEMAGRLEAMFVRELMIRVEALEDKATTAGGYECGDNSMCFVA